MNEQLQDAHLDSIDQQSGNGVYGEPQTLPGQLAAQALYDRARLMQALTQTTMLMRQAAGINGMAWLLNERIQQNTKLLEEIAQ